MSYINDYKKKNLIVCYGNLIDESPIIKSFVIPNKIIIVENNKAKYNIKRNGYKEETGLILGTDLEQTIDIPIYKLYKFTIVTSNPNDRIILYADGFTQEGNSIWVTEGTRITYTVQSSVEYKEITGTYTVTSDDKTDIIIPVELESNMYRVTIKPTLSPQIIDETADVTISCSNPKYKQIDNSIVIPYDNETTITYKVSKDDYRTFKGTYKLVKQRDTDLSVTINKFYRFSLRAMLYGNSNVDNDATIEITINNPEIFKEDTYYDVKSLIKYNNNYYNCIESHTSDNNFDSSKWKLIEKESNINEYDMWVTNGTSLTYTITRNGYLGLRKTILINSDKNILETLPDLNLFCTELNDNEIFVLEKDETIYLQEE